MMKEALPAQRALAPSAELEEHSGSAPKHPLQRLVDSSTRQTAQSGRLSQLQSAPVRNNPHGLPHQLRSGIEALSGVDMGDVTVHRNSAKPAQLSAAAYAQGSEIHLGPGQERHLPHEAWHVVQQRQGRVKPTMQMSQGVMVNDDRHLEHEADVMGAKAAQLKTLQGHAHQETDASGITASSQGVAQFVITRSMQKTINETVFNSEDDADSMRRFLNGRVSTSEIEEIIKRIWLKTKFDSDEDVFGGYAGETSTDFNESDEHDMNVADHGDLGNYENPEEIDKYILKELGVAQLARKGGTVSGPKSYASSNFGQFTDVSYKLSGKGSIDFTAPTAKTAWSNPVKAGSEVELSAAGKAIDKTNRPQHFAIGDALYAKKHGLGKASATTSMRAGKWTWHHLETPYKMVLVDMNAHAKHGHNGGVYLW
jgi:hypothetical protein